jgi:hypothetical protein
MELHLLERLLLDAIGQFAEHFPQGRAESMCALVNAGECGVALEILCDNLFDYDVIPDEAMFDRLAAIGTAMGIASRYWEQLRS